MVSGPFEAPQIIASVGRGWCSGERQGIRKSSSYHLVMRTIVMIIKIVESSSDQKRRTVPIKYPNSLNLVCQGNEATRKGVKS